MLPPVRSAVPASGAPSRLGGSLPVAAGAAPELISGSVAAAGLTAGAAATQVCGTDNAPTAAARPTPAEPAAPLSPAEPKDPSAPGPSPLARPDPEAVSVAALIPGINDFTWFAFESSALEIYPIRLVLDKTGLTVLSDEPSDASDGVDPVDDADDSGEASCCSAVGTVAITWDRTAWVLVLAAVPVAWATAAPCAASPAGLVVGCGGLNGVNVAALAEAPA